MKRTSKKSTVGTKAAAKPAEVTTFPHDAAVSDDELEIRFSLTALGEVAVAAGDRGGRGRRFRGFGPCGAVA
jgi:hypothetical protein